MKFMSIREFRSSTATVRKVLADREEIILTANGKPFALVSGLNPDRVEEEVDAIRRARALAAIREIQKDAKARGLDKMTMEEIDAEIAAARRERRNRK